MPEGLYISFDPQNKNGLFGNYYSKWTNTYTSAERSILQYDMKNTEFDSMTELYITFLDDGNHALLQLSVGLSSEYS